MARAVTTRDAMSIIIKRSCLIALAAVRISNTIIQTRCHYTKCRGHMVKPRRRTLMCCAAWSSDLMQVGAYPTADVNKAANCGKIKQ